MRLPKTLARRIGFLLLVLLSSAVQAQERGDKKNYLQVGAGVVSLQELGVRLGNSFTLFFPVSRRVERVTGPLRVSYLREVHPNWKVGIVSSYTYLRSSSFDHLTDQGQLVKTKTAEERMKFYTFMPTVEGTWVKSEIAQLYSGLSLGLFVTEVEGRSFAKNSSQHRSRSGYFGHLNLIGLRMGKRVGGYLELGFGVHGLLSGGVYGTF